MGRRGAEDVRAEVGAKLLNAKTKKTAYDRAGRLREVLGPKQAYELYVMQQAAADEMDRDPEARMLEMDVRGRDAGTGAEDAPLLRA